MFSAPKMPRYETFFFRDLTVAITPQEIRELAMAKFRDFGLTADQFRAGHTPSSVDCPTTPNRDPDQRYYAIQVEAPFFSKVLPALNHFLFLGFGPAHPDPAQPRAEGEKPAPK